MSGDSEASIKSFDRGATGSLDALRLRMRRFSDERDWSRFHDPRSLVLALVGEVGELAELVQWRRDASASESMNRDHYETARLGEEMADILLYLLRLADVLDIDLECAALQKLEAAEHRYPVSEYHGRVPRKR